MTTDINERVLAAFQVEYKEHLETIRALVADVERGDNAVDEARLEEAFRRAHSMKGAARVCDLKPIETLGHRMETLFSRVRQGQVRLDNSLARVIKQVLDAIEDWMTALFNGQVPAEPSAALQAIDQRLDGQEAADQPATEQPTNQTTDLASRLRAAFQSEYQGYVHGIRSFLAKVKADPEAVSGEHLQEPFRMAHSLKGAAQAAEIEAVIALGERLESLFSRLQKGTLKLDDEVADVIQSVLASIEDEMGTPDEQGAAGTTPATAASSAAAPEVERIRTSSDARGAATATTRLAAEAEAQQPAPALQQVDTVRVSTESLDRLLRSSGQLHAEGARQDQLARELRALGRQVDDMERRRDSIHKSAAAGFHQLMALPELSRVATYVDDLERQVRTLARHARHVRLLQRRSSWLLSSLGREVQQDVRRARMAPAESVLQGFRKLVRDVARDDGKQVDFTVVGFDVRADRMVLQALKDPLMHMLRNAVIHGIERPDQRRRTGKDETGRVELKIQTVGNRLHAQVTDDGRGIDFAAVSEVAARRDVMHSADDVQRTDELTRLIFQPGFTTSKVVTELSGRGMGLSVVHECVARLQGEVRLTPQQGPGTTILISVPLSISTHRLLLVSSGEHTFAIPLHAIQRLLRIKVANVETVEGRPVIDFQHDLIPLTSLAHVLGAGESVLNAAGDVLHVVILTSAGRRVALCVDGFLAERDTLIQDLTGPTASMRVFAGGILREDGRVALVLNPAELMESMKSSHRAPTIKTAAAKPAERLPTVLVVDDSFTTRTLLKSLLAAHGYLVHVAVDGVEALLKLQGEDIDVVITDIQMPRMDGFGLLEEIKKDQRLAALPVILVTSMDRREDQERGLALGADAYIVKRKFDHQDLLQTIGQVT
jgi:two-component system chemotaxis sensor kinase CheA